MKIRPILQSFLGLPLTIISFVFIGKIFFDNRQLILQAIGKIDILIFLLGIIFFAAFFSIKAYVWTIIIQKRGGEGNRREIIYQYSLAEVKRYIPGGIFAVIGRLSIKSHEINKKETLKGIGIEAILLAVSALLVSIPAFYLTVNIINKNLLIPLNLGGIVLFFIALIIGIKFRNYLFDYLKPFLLLVLAWIFYGIGSFLILLSFTSIDPETTLTVISIFTLSWLAGYLFVIAPMGLGVRELVNTFLLSIFIPFPIATVVSIFSRIGMMVGELIFLIVSYAISKIKDNSKLLIHDSSKLLVIFFAVIYGILFSFLSFLKHDTFLTGRFDLGNMSQTVWNTANGNFFMLTNPDGVENVSRLAVHSDFILALLAPFYLIWSDPKMLLLIQTFVLAIGGVFVYLIAKKVIKNKTLAIVLSLSYYLNFWLHEQNLFDFHAVSLATTFILSAFYFLIKKNYWLFSIMLFLSVITKENVFLIASGFGIYFFVKEKKYILGSLLFAIPILIFYYIAAIAIPGARGEEHFALGAYSYLGGSTIEKITNIFTQPQIIFAQIVNFSTLIYFIYHLIPTGFLALLSPFFLIFTIPDIAIYLLSSNFEYRSYEYHFGALFIPFIYISTIYSVRFLRLKFGVKILPMIFYYILVTSLLSLYLFSPLPGMLKADYGPFYNKNSGVIRKYLQLIPMSASVAATNNIAAHLSHREYIFVVPYGMDRADFIAIYKDGGKFKDMIDQMQYEEIIVDKTNEFYLYKKRIKVSCSSCRP